MNALELKQRRKVMANFPYLTNPTRLKAFLKKIQEVGVPTKVTIKYLKGLGFKSSNDIPLVSAMKNLGFLSSSGEPTKRWKAYRNKKDGPAILAQAIRENYATLYQMYPDAHLKDNEALRNFFSTHTDVGSTTLDFIVRSFKAITSLANFETKSQLLPKQNTAASLEGIKSQSQTPQSTRSGLVLNVNIQLTLPEGSTADTFEDFFKAMRKHLFD